MDIYGGTCGMAPLILNLRHQMAISVCCVPRPMYARHTAAAARHMGAGRDVQPDTTKFSCLCPESGLGSSVVRAVNCHYTDRATQYPSTYM